MPGKVDLVIESVAGLLKDISSQTLAFEQSVAYKCRPGCGACCTSPSVEAQVVEMLPMAKQLIVTGKLDQCYDRLSRGREQSCILYEPNPQNKAMGRCSQYDFRPGVCRLFGFSAVEKKTGINELVTCQVHKKTHPQAVLAAEIEVRDGAQVPVISEFNFLMRNLASESSLEFSMPINQALKMAIEKLMLSRQYSDQVELIKEFVPLSPLVFPEIHH